MRTLRLAIAVASLAALPALADGGGAIGSGTRSGSGMIGSGTRTAETCVATSTTDTCRGGWLIGGGARSIDVGTGLAGNGEGLVGSGGGRSGGYFGSGLLSVRDERRDGTITGGSATANGDGGLIGSGVGRSGYLIGSNAVARDAQPVVTVIETGDAALVFITLE